MGLDDAWVVSQVDLAMAEKKVEILLAYRGGRRACPDCGATHSQANLASERQLRYLDTMQFKAIVRARTPRANCLQCGVKTIVVPWADMHARFTLLFEAFAIEADGLLQRQTGFRTVGPRLADGARHPAASR